MKKLVIDLGNSETRITVIAGKSEYTGAPLQETVRVDNRYGLIQPAKVSAYLNEGVYSSKDSHIFEINNEYYCTGNICLSEFSSTCTRPTALDKKYTSISSKLAVINAFITGYEIASKLTKCDISELDEDWEVVILLPPMDIEVGASKLAEMVKNIKEVNSLMPKLSKPVNVTGVNVVPEALAALIGTVFSAPKTTRMGYEYLLDGNTNTLICDIGAGTTDFIMSRGTKIVNTSRFTREIGGNNVHQRVRMLLKERGIQLSDKDVRNGTETGYITVGNSTMDITKFIAVAKADVAKQLIDALLEFFENAMIPVQSINNILVTGGGAEKSENEKISPLSDYVISFLADKSPNINIVEQPVFMENGDYTEHPRMLNILGASIIAGQSLV